MSGTQIHLRKDGFWRLLHNPDEIITFKDVMDNFRNYAIVGSLFFFARVALSNPSSSGWLRFSAMVLIVAAMVTGLMCAAQTWVLGQKGVYSIWAPQSFWTTPQRHKEQLKLMLLLSIPILVFVVSMSVAYAAIFQLITFCK